jgi:hypothetical protein
MTPLAPTIPLQSYLLDHWYDWYKIKITTADRTYTWMNRYERGQWTICYFYNCGSNDAHVDLLKSRLAIEMSLIQILSTMTAVDSIKVKHRTTLESTSISLLSHKDIAIR